MERAAAEVERLDAKIDNAKDAIPREARRGNRPIMPARLNHSYHSHRDGRPAAFTLPPEPVPAPAPTDN